jgi:hypothetical protein
VRLCRYRGNRLQPASIFSLPHASVQKQTIFFLVFRPSVCLRVTSYSRPFSDEWLMEIERDKHNLINLSGIKRAKILQFLLQGPRRARRRPGCGNFCYTFSGCGENGEATGDPSNEPITSPRVLSRCRLIWWQLESHYQST